MQGQIPNGKSTIVVVVLISQFDSISQTEKLGSLILKILRGRLVEVV